MEEGSLPPRVRPFALQLQSPPPTIDPLLQLIVARPHASSPASRCIAPAFLLLRNADTGIVSRRHHRSHNRLCRTAPLRHRRRNRSTPRLRMNHARTLHQSFDFLRHFQRSRAPPFAPVGVHSFAHRDQGMVR